MAPENLKMEIINLLYYQKDHQNESTSFLFIRLILGAVVIDHSFIIIASDSRTEMEDKIW